VTPTDAQQNSYDRIISRVILGVAPAGSLDVQRKVAPSRSLGRAPGRTHENTLRQTPRAKHPVPNTPRQTPRHVKQVARWVAHTGCSARGVRRGVFGAGFSARARARPGERIGIF